jgi:hypothetical protein
MEDELQVVFIIHGGSPQSCRRCYVSTRPPCSSCGHALSGNIETSTNQTVCEFCGTAQDASGLTPHAADAKPAPLM